MKPPEAVLTEAVRDALNGRQVEHLLFTTHDLEPQFFEEEILPSLFDDDFKHNRVVRLAQIDQRLRSNRVGIDVYFEPRGLRTSEGTAQLGWNRIPVTGTRGGVFHPKVMLALCHPEADAAGSQSLVVLTASANLTRGGWWTNVETAHVHVIEAGSRDRFAAGLHRFVDRLHSNANGLIATAATQPIRDFLRTVEDFSTNSHNGVLRPHFYQGRQSIPDFLGSVLGNKLSGLNLEVMAPFVDPTDDLPTLTALVARFRPRGLRVMVPFTGGKVACSESAYAYVEGELHGTWGRLPSALIKHGAGLQAGERGVHAKVYRFWSAGSERLEYILAGSPNLTTAGHAGNRNVEAAVLVQNPRPGLQSWWLDRVDTPPREFAGPIDELDVIAEGTADLPLILIYDWRAERGRAYWNSTKPRTVTVRAAGVDVVALPSLPARDWIVLNEADSDRIRDRLRSSCTATVHASEHEWAPLLIQEENHQLKESLATGLNLSPAEILAFWSLLSPEERIARLGELTGPWSVDEEEFELPELFVARPDSMFERFAGVFHAFGSLRRHVLKLLEEGDDIGASQRLFGNGVDSQLRLLHLMASAEDAVQAYVTYQCGTQLLDEVSIRFPDFVADFPVQRDALTSALAKRDELRSRLMEDAGEDLTGFLTWFDSWFLTRVTGSVK